MTSIKITHPAYSFLRQRQSLLLSLIAGAAIVLWTVLRFLTTPSYFDLVGQQVLAHQWLQGSGSGAIVGPTNYVLKMLFIYLPLDILPGSPRLKLIAVTLVINIVTYVLLLFVTVRICREFGVDIFRKSYLALVWLATIAGSVFWINFSNSRNLEVAGGVILMLLGIRAVRAQPGSIFRRYGLFTLLAALLFFADPLQIYMTLLPLLLFVSLRWLYQWLWSYGRLADMYRIAGLALSGGLAVIASKLLFAVASHVWGVQFIATGAHNSSAMSIGLLVHSLAAGVLPAAKQLAVLYIGGFELGKIVQLVNLVFVSGIGVVGVYYAWRKLISSQLALLIGTVFIVDLAVYIVSGQALQPNTARYLIMTVPYFIIMIIAVLGRKTKLQPVVIAAIIAVIAVNLASLSSAVARAVSAPAHYDDHQAIAVDYIVSHNLSYGYASMDTALPAAYYSHAAAHLLPLECTSDTNTPLRPSYLFYGRAEYVRTRAINTPLIAIIFDGKTIHNTPAVCSVDQAYLQFGEPVRQDQLRDGSTVLLYPTGILKQLLSTR